MACSNCGFDNREETRFCVECGAALARRCPGCQADVQPGQKFCGECGTALTGAPTPHVSAPSAVRKTVTVVFADLGGSTGFGERTDAEVARQVLARYHALLQETIDAHAGTVAKFMGDGMMATFGIPEVAEDDARRAVAAGVALQQRFETFAADVASHHGETLTLRVGINTGEVVIGEGDADLIGDALNVAARLEKACTPGRVLVGEETWRLTRGDLAYDALGEVTVAGRAEPVAIYEVAVDSEAEPEVATPFVGRDAEMQRLVGVFDDARAAARANLVTVLGSPGVGKTRLSRELGARLADHAGARTVELRCDRAGEATFEPVAQLVRDAAGLTDDLDADASRAAIGALLATGDADRERIVDALTGLVGVGPARSVEETFWGVRRLIEATAADQPLVVVIDDIQWAEPLLLDLIEHLAEWVADAAVLLVGLARPELREVRPSLAEPGRPVAAVVVLDGLDASATEALAAGLLGAERLPEGLVERLPESTDGNPLFVRELVRMLVDDRVIRRRADDEWELTIDAEAVEVPPTIQSLLGARVERLPVAERELLEHASVVGAEFSLGALRELAGEHAPVTSLLEHMRRKELVEPTGSYAGDQPVYRFHHVLIRDAAYRRLLKTTRAELHERVALWTDRTAADLAGEHEAATAFHYEHAYRYRSELSMLDDDTARLGRRAAELLATAAQRALGRDDLASAGALSARALALLPESDRAARADLLQMGCECLLAAGNGAAARPLVEELGRSAAGDPRLAAWAECYAAQLVGLTDPDGLVAADAQAQAAAGALTELGDGSGQAKAHQVRASLLGRLGRIGECELELDLALAAARAADDRRRVTAVLGAAPDAALFGPSPVPRAGGRCLDVVRLLRITTASPAVEAASNRCQAVLESLRGRFDVSRSMLASARDTLEELGLRHALAQTELYAGMVELIAGDPHAAIAPLRAAFGGLGALGVGADAGNAAALLARALLVDGGVDEADEMATASEHLAGQNLKTAIGWRVARAEVLAARGDLAGAVTIAEQAVEIAAGTDLVIDHADACAALATLRARAGDASGARAARADALRLYEQKGATVPAERLAAEQPPAAATAVPPSPPAAPASALRIENMATRAHARAIHAIAADAVTADIYAPEFQYDDRRPVIGAGEHDRDGALEILELTREEGQELDAPTPIAIRGDRLALSRSTVRWSNGYEQLSLDLVEVDEQGRLLAYGLFGEADLDAAIDELDTRYLAGEGAEHADEVGLVAAWRRVFEDGDADAIRRLAAPGFVWVDHQQIGWGTVGIDDVVEMFGSLAGLRTTLVVSRVLVRDRCILFTGVSDAVDAEGAEVTWAFHAAGVHDGSGRAARVEIFAADDWDAALARFDELSAPPTHSPRVENTASRVWTQTIAAIVSGDNDTLRDLFAREYRYDDRRPTVNLGAVDRAGGAELLKTVGEEGWQLRPPTAIAVRGDRLALLSETHRTAAGHENSQFSVVEVDEQAQLVAGIAFGDDDLAAAIDELEERYVAGEGTEHAPLVRCFDVARRALSSHDLETVRGVVAPGWTHVDHREVEGHRVTGLEEFIEIQRAYHDISMTMFARTLRIAGDTMLCTLETRGVDTRGTDVVWVDHIVCSFDAAARMRRLESFSERHWDAALARFEELSRTDATPRIENTASRAWARALAAIGSEDNDALTDAFARDYRFDDRRAVVNLGAFDRAGAAKLLERVDDEGWELWAPTALAVRGDRLALLADTYRTAAGDENPALTVVEVDEHGRLVAGITFGDDDLAAAEAELDARYLAGEGSEHADVLQAYSAAMRVFKAHDYAGIRDHATSDFVWVDHRELSWGTLDVDGFIAQQETYADLRHSYLSRTLRVAGRAVLATMQDEAVSPDGTDSFWAFHMVVTFDSSDRCRRSDVYAEDDWDAALACFDELSRADPRTPRVENAASQQVARVVDLFNEGRFDECGALMAQDMRLEDRRSIVGGGSVGRAAHVANLETIAALGDRNAEYAPFAVRGSKLVLGRITSDFGDWDSRLLALIELGANGLASSAVYFDENALDAAVAELETRYIAGEGAGYAAELRQFHAMSRAVVDRDDAAIRALLAPNARFVEHRPLGLRDMDVDAYIDVLHAYADVETISYYVTTITAADRVLLATFEARASDRDGSEGTWRFHAVNQFDSESRIARIETIAEDDWGAALARFDQLAATSDAHAPALENLATRNNERFRDVLAAEGIGALGRLVRPGYTYVDHRWGGAAPESEGPDGFLDHVRSARAAGFVGTSFETLAVRGEYLSLARFEVVTEAGDVVDHLAVSKVDTDGLGVRTEVFEAGDLDRALALLDDWYVAGEGAEHEELLRTALELDRAFRADQDAAAAMFATDFVFDDHRRLYYGTGDLAHLTAARRASDETGLDFVTTVNRKVFVAGRTILTLQHAQRSAPDGRDFEWTAWLIAAFDSSLLLRRLEYFDEDDSDAALARFDELSRSDSRTPRVENTATRNVDHLFDAIRAGRWDDAAAQLAAAFVRVDNRTGVADATAVGPDAYLAAFRSAVDVGFTTVTTEHLAVRGDRLSLLRSTFTTDGGSELVIVSVYEIDANARGVHLSLYDPDDLAAAFDELDARHCELAGGADTPEMKLLAGFAAVNRRDWDGFAAYLAPDLVMVDHQPLSFGTTDRDGFIDALRTLIDVMPDVVVVVQKTFESPAASLAVVQPTGRTPVGNEYVWETFAVVRTNGAGLADRAEFFSPDDWDAALARFDELTAEATPTSPEIENTATRLNAAWVEAKNAGRSADLEHLIAPDYIVVSHRFGGIVPPSEGVDQLRALSSAGDDVGFSAQTIEPVALRGDRLALVQLTATTADGFISERLEVTEIDEQSRFTRTEIFDVDDLARAVALLDDWYIAGEGRPDAAVLETLTQSTVASNAKDWARFPSLYSPDFTFVDHTTIGWPELDLDGYVAIQRSYVDQVHVSSLTRWVRVRGRAALATTVSDGTDPAGGTFEWVFHVVSCFDADHRYARTEVYAEDDFAAALARFDELAAEAEPTGPEIENAATHSMARFPELARARRFDAMADLIAQDYVRIDHRQGVPAPTSHGPDDFVAIIRATVDVGFDEIRNTPLAVRGDRLALSRVEVRAPDGREIVFLQLHEWDASQLVYAAHYDEVDLAAALAELDTRYLASGEATAPEERALHQVTALNRGDWEAYLAEFPPGFVATDNRRLGFATLDRDDFVDEQREALFALVSGVVIVPAKLLVAGDAVLIVFRTIGTSAEGSGYEWSGFSVARNRETLDIFADDQWDAALARFDELAAATPAPAAATTYSYALLNRAARCAHAYDEAFAAQDWDRIAASYADDVVNDDRRKAVNSGVTTGRDGLVELVRQLVRVGFTTGTQTPVAVRGEALALVQRTFRTESGSCLELLGVIEYDEDDRLTANVIFDLDDRAAALQELEDRYCASESTADAYLIRRAGDLVRSMAAPDGAATVALVHPDVRFTDHRRLGLGTMGIDGVRGILAARAEQIAEDTSYFRDLTVDGSTMMGLLESTGTSPDGSEVLWELYWVARWVAGKMLDIDWYERAERDAARARFDELADVDPRTPHVDNALVRKLVAGAWHQAFDPAYDPQAEMAAQNAADVVVDDRRRGVSIGVLHGHDEMDENVRAQDGLFGPTIFEPIAVRGEHLALARTRAVAPSGFELVSLGVVETDAEGRYRSWTFFDDDALDDALAELDERVIAAEGAEHANVVRAAARIDRAFNNDPDALGALCSPEFVLDDHRRLMYGDGDRQYLVSIRRASSDAHVRATATINRSLFVQGRALLAVQDLHRDDTEGAEFRWAYSVLVVFDASWRLQRLEWFDDDNWEAALARFDELAAGDA